MPPSPLRLARRSLYPLLVGSVFFLIILAVHLVLPAAKRAEFFVPAILAAAGFAYFIYAQHLQETKLFSELFREFNKKYDSLNEALNQIAERPSEHMLTQGERQSLYDYFNLCAEEHMYFTAGYIDVDVWKSWKSGMRVYFAHPAIRSLWAQELKTGSYYSFTLEAIG